MRALKNISKFLLFFSLLLVAGTYFYRTKLPAPDEILPALYKEPLQTTTDKKPLTIKKGEFRAEITPLFNYQLYGLVVSDYDSDTWYDYIHKRYDPFNTKDICVVWGDNLRTDIYRHLKYKHGEFSCYAGYDVGARVSDFHLNQFSNNHLVPATHELYKKIKKAKVGDQIFFSGYLVNNNISGPKGLKTWRNSSLTRDDTGKHACEVVYTDDFRILKTGRPFVSFLYAAGKYLALGSLLVFLLAFYYETQQGFKYLRQWQKGKNPPEF